MNTYSTCSIYVFLESFKNLDEFLEKWKISGFLKITGIIEIQVDCFYETKGWEINFHHFEILKIYKIIFLELLFEIKWKIVKGLSENLRQPLFFFFVNYNRGERGITTHSHGPGSNLGIPAGGQQPQPKCPAAGDIMCGLLKRSIDNTAVAKGTRLPLTCAD